MISIRLLGPAEMHDPSGERGFGRLLGQPKRFALLAYLAGNAPQLFHRRESIMALFWPESTTAQARHGLRQVLYELRKQLGEDAILTRGAEEVALNGKIVTCDVADFYTALGEGDFERAVERYGGPFLQGLFVPGAPDVEDWIARRRGTLCRDVVDASWRMVEQRRDRGDLRGAVTAAHYAVERAPSDEDGVRRLLELLHEDGNRGEAARVFDELGHRLADDFDTEPSAETAALMARIQETTVGAASGSTTIRAADPPPPAPPAPTPEHEAVQSRTTDQAPMVEPAAVRASVGRNHPGVAAALFGVASLVILGVINLLKVQLGLPDWVLSAAVVLLLVGLPVVVVTALTERKRVVQDDHRKLPWLTMRRSLRGGGLALLGLAVTTGGFMGLRAAGIAPAGTLLTMGVLEARDPILVPDFATRAEDPTLGAALTELLRIDLSQSRVVKVVDPATLRASLDRMGADPLGALDEPTALGLAEREGIKAMLLGTVSQLGPGYVLSARLLSSPDGALLGSVRVTADDEAALIGATDRLSAWLRERVGESLREVRASPELHRVTTTSIEALRLYTQAMGPAGLQEGEMAGRRMLEQAVVLDPTFAMAHRRLAVVSRRTGDPDAAVLALRRAFELRDHLPEVERLLVEAFYYSEVAFDGAARETAYRAALALDPDNQIALINLAAAQSLSRRWASRESLALRSMEARPSLVAVLNVFNAQLLQGKFTEAQATIDAWALRAGAAAPSGNLQFDLESARRNYDRAEAALLKDTPSEDRRRWARLMQLRGRFADARRMLEVRTADGPGASPPPLGLVLRAASLDADRGSPGGVMLDLDDYPADSVPPWPGCTSSARSSTPVSGGSTERAPSSPNSRRTSIRRSKDVRTTC